jgi:hypothetical protein
VNELFHIELLRQDRGLDRRVEFRGWVSDDAIMDARRDYLGALLIDDCQGEGRTAADWLLALEYIVRRAIQRESAQQPGAGQGEG